MFDRRERRRGLVTLAGTGTGQRGVSVVGATAVRDPGGHAVRVRCVGVLPFAVTRVIRRVTGERAGPDLTGSAFHSGVHRNAYIAIPLRRHHSGRMHNGGGGGRGSGDSGQGRLRGRRRKAFVGHLVDPRFPGREPVQRRRRRLVARLVPRKFFAARRVNLRVVVSDVRLNAH